MDRLDLTNAIRQEAYNIKETYPQFNVFPSKVQDIIYNLGRYENYNIEYCASVILSAAASAIGNACQIHIKGAWYNSPALYMMLVGRPGLGKTPPMGFLYKPLRDLDEVRLNEYCEAMKAFDSLSGDGPAGESPKLIKAVISDFTAEAMISAHYNNPRGVSVVVDEILGFFKSINRYNNRSNLIELFLTAYSGQPLDFIRKSEKYPTHIRHPCINLLGSIQTSLLGNVLCDEFESNGLLDRFLFVYPKDKRISEWSLSTSPLNDRPDIEGEWSRILSSLLSLPCLLDNISNLRPHFIEMEAVAKECFYDWNNSIIRAVNSVSNDMEVESRKMKLNSNAGRIALILQLLKWASGEGHMDYVDLESVSGAIDLIDYYEQTYDRIKTLAQDKPQDGSSWILRLNDEFTTKDAERAAMQAGLSRRSVYNALDRMSSGPNPLFIKTGHGQYAKIHDSAPCTFALLDKNGGNYPEQRTDTKIVVKGYPKVQEKVQSAKVQSAIRNDVMQYGEL